MSKLLWQVLGAPRDRKGGSIRGPRAGRRQCRHDDVRRSRCEGLDPLVDAIGNRRRGAGRRRPSCTGVAIGALVALGRWYAPLGLVLCLAGVFLLRRHRPAVITVWLLVTPFVVERTALWYASCSGQSISGLPIAALGLIAFGILVGDRLRRQVAARLAGDAHRWVHPGEPALHRLHIR